jgi:hypothetical protein
MIRTTRPLPYLASLLAAAVIVLQFAAVQHSIEHGGALPDIGCEFCVSGTATASLSSHSAVQHPAPSFADAGEHGSAASPPASRRALPPARGPPTPA